ncbi:MAG: peptidoglycan DD-metalloendopeptidase family protein [Acidobacteria bacterium]|nr:peptidoglycan DD-metalloendopeptidase family protein [Acidobacteriota bacterium]
MTRLEKAVRRLSCIVAAGLILGGASWIQAQEPEGLAGTWQGAIAIGPNTLRVKLEVSKTRDGIYLGTLVSIDQGGARIPIDRIEGEGDQVRFEARAVKGSFEGTMNADKSKISGTWSQGQPLPLVFERTGEAAEPATAAEPPKRGAHPLGLPLVLDVGFAPTPFQADGRTHLCYELHITNWSAGEALLSRIEVLAGDSPLASFEGAELNGLLARPGAPGVEDRRALGAGLRAVAYLWITIEDGAAAPRSLRHRITADGLTVDGGEASVSTAKPLVLGPPLRGSGWLAGNGPANDSIHRRALLPVEGKARLAQRFAIDWVKLGADEQSFEGDRQRNENFHAYGEDALAVADATVIATKDGIPENEPGPRSRAVPMTLETLGGNFVVLGLPGDRYAFYAHLQPGSLRVKPGDAVKRGQALGLVGNSGNSTEPHLHFHVSDGPSPLGSQGIPYLLDSYELLSGDSPGRRERQLPLQDDQVSFPE